MVELERPPCPDATALSRGDYKHPANKQALLASTYNKCMYCESRIRHIDYGDVEHIRPKAPNKFPELEFTWENLGIACGVCNGNKGDKFDVNTPYINPYEDDPADYLLAEHAWVFPLRNNERGLLTITDLGLNRPELLERRSALLERIMTAIAAADRTANAELRRLALESLAKEAAPSSEYSMVVTARLRAHRVM
jgi:5-methylcytosine-specific restriction endonuclease McrA